MIAKHRQKHRQQFGFANDAADGFANGFANMPTARKRRCESPHEELCVWLCEWLAICSHNMFYVVIRIIININKKCVSQYSIYAFKNGFVEAWFANTSYLESYQGSYLDSYLPADVWQI